MKPTAKRETQPHLGHVPEPARTPEDNVENIREEIKSYLALALYLFEQPTTKWAQNNRTSWYPAY